MKILSIDPGFERMGVAVIERTKDGGKPFVVYSGCVTTSKKDEFSERLKKIGESVRGIIKKYKPEVFAIEKLFFSTNQKTALSVAEARGVAVYEASLGNMSFFEYTPIQIKVAVAGYGRATKEQVIFMAQNLVDFKYEEKKARDKKLSDDEFDAIAVGITHIAHSKPFLNQTNIA